jgi:hypothetical protein
MMTIGVIFQAETYFVTQVSAVQEMWYYPDSLMRYAQRVPVSVQGIVSELTMQFTNLWYPKSRSFNETS